MTAAAPLDFALRYAARGWPVFPVHSPENGGCSCRQSSCGRSIGKHPRTLRGFNDASLDLGQLGAWWKEWPKANVAIRTGAELLVLDVDPRHGGGASLERLQREHGDLPSTASVRTGGGGAHLYFRTSSAVRSRTNVAGYGGLDLKGDEGYVVAPPSLHASGGCYRWHLRERIAEAPAWLIELANWERPRPVFQPREPHREPLRGLDDVLRECPRVRARFERNTAGLRDTSPSGVDLGLASGLALLGFDADGIARALLESRERAGLPTKSPSYVRSTVKRALEVRV